MSQHFIARGDLVRTPQGVGRVLGSWGIAEDVEHRVELLDEPQAEPQWYPRRDLVWPAYG